MNEVSCPFCNQGDLHIVFQDAHAFAVYDAFPVNPGHMLVISREHERDFFQLSLEAQENMTWLLGRCREHLDTEFSPDGYNIGLNIGKSAGQTVMHAHLHIIPRYEGDVEDPRGGVRGVIPDRRSY
ncbi:MAG: HIT family protein [Candidatus Methanomethylophilaceae archaeon]